MCLCERLMVLRGFAASREIQQGPISREAKTLVYFGLAVLVNLGLIKEIIILGDDKVEVKVLDREPL